MSEINNGQKNEITKEVKIMFGQCGYNGKLHLDLAVKRFQEVKDAFSDDISAYKLTDLFI